MITYSSSIHLAQTDAAPTGEDEEFSLQRRAAQSPEANIGEKAPGVFSVAIRFTIVTTILLGILYPLVVTGIAQLTMRDKANGQLIMRDSRIIGSKLIGQSFIGAQYFHGRPSAAGSGYDATNSGGSNLGPSNKTLIARINSAAADRQQNPSTPVPIDMVTTSASGLDPDITPAAAFYQVSRVSAARHLPESDVRALVRSHIEERQFGVLGESRINVLDLNLALDELVAH